MSHVICLARHGETADNARRVFQGQAGSGLNRLGKAQAQRLADRLTRRPPGVIFSSDLERAAETAQIVADACKLPITLDRALREVDVGLWTGKGYDEIHALYPEEWAAWDAGLDVRRGGGETYAELADRIDAAIADITSKVPAGTSILIVSHGGSIKSWIAKLLGVGPEGLRALAGVANTGLTVVERDIGPKGPRHRLHTWNDVSHLEGLTASEHSD